MDKILVPTDGAKGTEKVAEFANRQARVFSAEVHALCVQEVAGGVKHSVSDSQGSIPSDEETIEEYLDAVTDNLDDQITAVRTTSKSSDVSEEIVEYADENSIDHIVMGTSSKTSVERVLMGSIAEKVIRKSRVPVTTIREKSELQSEE